MKYYSMFRFFSPQITKFILSLSFILVGFGLINAQEDNVKKSQFSVGIDNTRLIFGQYTYNNHLIAKLNLSVYSEKISLQYARATVGYQYKWKNINLCGEYFFGSAFNGNYFNTGVLIKGDAQFFKRLLIDVELAPWYDSGYGYTTCFEGRIGCNITRQIDIKVGYTTIPEYRMSENRILAGFDFSTSRLSVSPYLSIGTKASDGGKNIRMVLGFCYNF